MEKFIISKKATGGYKFDFIDKKGRVVLRSVGYTRKIACINGIECVKRNSQFNSKFKCEWSLKDGPFFNLKSFNGTIICISIIYKNKMALDNAIEFVKSKTPDAPIVDLSKQ